MRDPLLFEKEHFFFPSFFTFRVFTIFLCTFLLFYGERTHTEHQKKTNGAREDGIDDGDDGNDGAKTTPLRASSSSSSLHIFFFLSFFVLFSR